MPIPKKSDVAAPKSAKIRVFEALRDWIIDGTLQPGEKLLDGEISQYFSVSRTPVREAMQMLAEQKLIEVFPGRESRVSSIDIINIPETYRMLAELHALAVDFAYDKITESDIAALRKANERFLKSHKNRDIAGCREHDKEFHDIFIGLAGNDFLTSFCDTLNGHAARIENAYFTKVSDMEDLISEHNEIIAALEAHDPARAREFMRANWLHTPEVIGVIKE